MPKRKRNECPQSRKKRWKKEDVEYLCSIIHEEVRGLSAMETGLKIIKMATERDLIAGNSLTDIQFLDEISIGSPWDVECPSAPGRVDKSGNITIKHGEDNIIIRSVEKKKASWVSTRNYGKRQIDLFHPQPNKEIPSKFQMETFGVKFVFGENYVLMHSASKFLFSISFSIRGSYVAVEFARKKVSEPLMLTSTSSDVQLSMGRVMVNIV